MYNLNGGEYMALPINIEYLIGGTVVESARLELKRGWNPDSIYRTICAFANDFEDTGSGYIVVGVEEENGMPVRPVCGININELDRMQREMTNFNNLIQPYYQPRTSIEEIDNKQVFVIWVTAGDRRPYKVPEKVKANHKNYKYFIRCGSSTIEAKGEYEMELFNLANRIPFDDRGNASAKIEDVSMLLVRDFLIQTDSKLLQQIESVSPSFILEQMNLLDGPKENLRVKNVALMLFSYHPEKFFPGTQVDIVIYPKGKDEDPDNFIELEPIIGPIHQIIKKVLDYFKMMIIRQKVSKKSTKEESERIYNYPYQAIEEAIVNALYHRSYQEREPVEISIMPDRIEIVSYSGADRSINLDDLRAGRRIHARRYRNRRLGDFLKELNLTEGRGTGFPTIKKELEKNGSSPANFDSDDERTFFFISIPCHPDFIQQELRMDENGLVMDEVHNHSNIRALIFHLIVEDTHISRKRLSERVGIAPSAVQKHISYLISQGYIKREGRTNGSYFVILKDKF